MVEGWVVRVLISMDFGGLWNPVRRLVETDNRSRGVSKQTQFNIIYIMRNMVLRHKPQYPSDLRRRNLFSTRTTFNTRDASCPVHVCHRS